MNNYSDKCDIELICIIVNNGLGSKILKAAKQHGILGGTVFLGKGTVKNKVLEFLDLADIDKELVIMLSDKKTADNALEELDKVFAFNKPNHGIAFSTSVKSLIGTHQCRNINQYRSENDIMYDAIYVIVEKGKAEFVVDAATKVGAKGGTIINARGSGIHETSKLFSMDIEPEREIVLILSECINTEMITASISEELKIDEPGNGIIFIQGVNNVYGVY